MATLINKWQSNNGELFDTENEAKLKDTCEKLKELLSEKMYKGIDSYDMADVIEENADEFHRLISEIKGQKSIIKKNKELKSYEVTVKVKPFDNEEKEELKKAEVNDVADEGVARFQGMQKAATEVNRDDVYMTVINVELL